MGSRAVTLGLSVALLAACAVILWQRHLLRDQAATATALPAPPIQSGTATRTVTQYVTNFVTLRQAVASGTNTLSVSPAGGQFQWRKVETDDYQTYIANLRSIGCPEQTIRDIVIADVNKLFAARRAELTGGKVTSYWESAPAVSPEVRAELTKQFQEIEQEKTVLVRDLLGIDLATELRKNREGDVYPDNRLGFLSPEKQDQVSVLREAFNEQWPRIQADAAAQGKSAAEISDELRRADEQRLANLAKILTPEELRAHELQTSWTAINLRNQLNGFYPTESEFQAIYDLQKAYDDRYIHYAPNTTDDATRQQKEAARDRLQIQIHQALGKDRYGEYLRAQAARQP